MKIRRGPRSAIAGAAAFLALATVMLGSGPASAGKGTRLDLALCAPDKNEFTLMIDNTYFPLPDGQQWVFTGKEQRRPVGLRITVLDATEDLFGGGLKKVSTRIVEEIEWSDANSNGSIDHGEDLIEVSQNYFAQTEDRTVCYFGEDVAIYEGGVVVSDAGSWRADRPGNAPGIFMPAAPKVGMTFQQEVAPGIALDEATVVATGTVTVPVGTFPNSIKTRDFNPLDGSKGTKWYAPGVGLVVDGSVELVAR